MLRVCSALVAVVVILLPSAQALKPRQAYDRAACTADDDCAKTRVCDCDPSINPCDLSQDGECIKVCHDDDRFNCDTAPNNLFGSDCKDKTPGDNQFICRCTKDSHCPDDRICINDPDPALSGNKRCHNCETYTCPISEPNCRFDGSSITCDGPCATDDDCLVDEECEVSPNGLCVSVCAAEPNPCLGEDDGFVCSPAGCADEHEHVCGCLVDTDCPDDRRCHPVDLKCVPVCDNNPCQNSPDGFYCVPSGIGNAHEYECHCGGNANCLAGMACDTEANKCIDILDLCNQNGACDHLPGGNCTLDGNSYQCECDADQVVEADSCTRSQIGSANAGITMPGDCSAACEMTACCVAWNLDNTNGCSLFRSYMVRDPTGPGEVFGTNIWSGVLECEGLAPLACPFGA